MTIRIQAVIAGSFLFSAKAPLLQTHREIGNGTQSNYQSTGKGWKKVFQTFENGSFLLQIATLTQAVTFGNLDETVGNERDIGKGEGHHQ